MNHLRSEVLLENINFANVIFAPLFNVYVRVQFDAVPIDNYNSGNAPLYE